MTKKTFFICLFFLNFIFINEVNSCSIFYAAMGNSMLAGNSEDWDDLNSMIQFYHAGNGKYGKIVFGFNDWGMSFCPWGGVNDQGLFYDWADIGTRDEDFHATGTLPYGGVLANKMLEECANVEEAIQLFKKYNSPGLGGAHILIADKYGNSVVIERAEGDSVGIIRKTTDYQIATNFLNAYLNDPEIYRWVQCPRYEYINEVLANTDSISIDMFQEILYNVGSNGTLSPTIYSNIYDFNSGKMYIYNYYNFDEVLVLDVNYELSRPARLYKLPELFSGMRAEYPVLNISVNSSLVEFKWLGDADNYEIWLSSDELFSNPIIYYYSISKNQLAGINLLGSIPIILCLLFGAFKNKKIIFFWFFFMVCIAGCEDLITELPDTKSGKEHIFTADNLEPNHTYYWKVVAINSNGFKTETNPQIFQTSDF
jgi:hypothetical protein